MAKGKSGPPAVNTLDARMRIVVLYGPEQMYRRQCLDALRKALAKEHGDLDPITFEGEEAALADVLDELRTFSLLQSHKLVVLDDESGSFVTRHREALERYADAPVENATLVIRGGTWPSNTKLYKRVAKIGAVMRCDPPPRGEAVKWIVAQAKQAHQITLPRDAADVLVDRLGCDLTRLDTAVAKLALLVEKGQAIDVALVEQTTGRTSEAQAYVVQDAVLKAMVEPGSGGVMETVHELIDLSRQPEIMVLYFVSDLMRKLQIGLAMKQAGASSHDITRELKLWGGRQGMFMEMLQKLDPGTASDLLNEAVQADIRSKTGLGTALRNLECFCATLSDKVA